MRPLDGRKYCPLSACVHSFWALAKAVLFHHLTTYIPPMCPQMCSIDIFVDLRWTNWAKIWKGGLFDHRGLKGVGIVGSGIAPSIARLWVPISSPFTHMVFMICQCDPDPTRITALVVTASSSGIKKWPMGHGSIRVTNYLLRHMGHFSRQTCAKRFRRVTMFIY